MPLPVRRSRGPTSRRGSPTGRATTASTPATRTEPPLHFAGQAQLRLDGAELPLVGAYVACDRPPGRKPAPRRRLTGDPLSDLDLGNAVLPGRWPRWYQEHFEEDGTPKKQPGGAKA